MIGNGFMEITGYRILDFVTKDGDKIQGVSIYLSESIEGGYGKSAEKFFLSQDKVDALAFTIELEQVVEVLFNRKGKLFTLRLPDPNDVPIF